MKFLLIFLLPLIAVAQDYDFLNFHHDLNSALKQATKEKKLLMLFEVQNHCVWCSKQARQTFTNQNIKNKISKNFIPLLLNIDEDTIPLAYKAEAVPAVYFINPTENEEVWRAIGYKDVDEMLEVFQKAKQSYARDLEDEKD